MRNVGCIGRQMLVGSGGGLSVQPAADVDISLLGAPLDARITFTRNIAASYWDSDGVLKQAGVNVPRWEFDPVGRGALGLLMEQAATNLVVNSNMSVMNSNGPPNDSTFIANSGTAPDGTNTATLLRPSTNNGGHQAYQLAAGSINTYYAFSVFLKSVSPLYYKGQIVLGNSSFPPNAIINFDLNLGTLTSVGSDVLNSGIQYVGNGWYRLFVSAQSLGTVGNYVYAIGMYDASGNGVFAGNGVDGLLMWGGQVEATSSVVYVPTSLMVTSGSSVTRGADLATMPTDTWLNMTNGTLAAEFLLRRNSAQTATMIFEIDSGAITNLIGIDIFNPALARGIIYAANVNKGSAITANSWVGSAINRAAVKYDPSNVATCLNGGAVASSAHTGLPATLNRVNIGSGRSVPISGYVRRIRYWGRTLSDAEMQTVTR